MCEGGDRTEFSQRQIAFLKDQSQFTVQNRSVLRNFGLANYFRFIYNLLPA